MHKIIKYQKGNVQKYQTFVLVNRNCH